MKKIYNVLCLAPFLVTMVNAECTPVVDGFYGAFRVGLTVKQLKIKNTGKAINLKSGVYNSTPDGVWKIHKDGKDVVLDDDTKTLVTTLLSIKSKLSSQEHTESQDNDEDCSLCLFDNSDQYERAEANSLASVTLKPVTVNGSKLLQLIESDDFGLAGAGLQKAKDTVSNVKDRVCSIVKSLGDCGAMLYVGETPITSETVLDYLNYSLLTTNQHKENTQGDIYLHRVYLQVDDTQKVSLKMGGNTIDLTPLLTATKSFETGKDAMGLVITDFSKLVDYQDAHGNDSHGPARINSSEISDSVNASITTMLQRIISTVVAPGLVMDQTPTQTTISGSTLYTSDFTQVKSHKNTYSFDVNVGYQKALGKFYIGAELGFGFAPGKAKTTVHKALNEGKSLLIGDYKIVPNSDSSFADEVLSYKTKYTASISLMPGITAGNWCFFVPLCLNISKNEVSIENPRTLDPSKVTIFKNINGRDYPLADVQFDPTANADDYKTKWKKTKVSFATGLGARFWLTTNIFIGLKGIHDFGSTIKANTPLDDRKVKVSSTTFALECGCRF